MLLSWLRRRKAPAPVARRFASQFRPALESLDSRICPAAPHFIGSAKASIDSLGALTVSWKEAGLGDSVNVDYTMTADASGQFQWFNHGGNKPQGQPFQFGPTTLQADGTFASGKNGNITASLTIAAPGPTEDVLDAGTSSNWVLKETVTYSNITLTDTTNGIPATVEPSSVGPVTIIVPT
jgi:hypothetical protein